MTAERPKDRRPRTLPWVADALYRTFAVTDKLFQHLDLPYTASDGTLLGALRHGGLIPWDDDLDIAMRAQDFERLDEVAAEYFGERGFGYFHHGWFGRVYPLDGLAIFRDYGYPYLDVHCMSLIDGMWLLTPEHQRKTWPNETYPADAFESLERVPFGPLEVSKVDDAIAAEFLTRMYGADWATTYNFYGFHLDQKYDAVVNRAVQSDPAESMAQKSGGTTSGRIIANPDLEVEEVADGLTIILPLRGQTHHLNSTASVVFCFATGNTVDEIAAGCQRTYRLPAPPVEEVERCVWELRRAGILRIEH